MPVWGDMTWQSRNGLIVWIDAGFAVPAHDKSRVMLRWACGLTGRRPRPGWDSSFLVVFQRVAASPSRVRAGTGSPAGRW